VHEVKRGQLPRAKDTLPADLSAPRFTENDLHHATPAEQAATQKRGPREGVAERIKKGKKL
jgi:hypothetical protein